MMSGNYCSCTRTKIGDYSPAVLIPYFIYFLQFVCVNPFGQGFLVLLVVLCSNFDERSDKESIGEDCDVRVVMFSLVIVWPP
jgi:hypothetical protein